MKKCSKCRVNKKELEFYKDRNTKDGLYAFCKSCANENTLKWRRKDAKINPQKYREEWKKKYYKNIELYRGIKKKNNKKLKLNLLKGYGGEKLKCACCGEKEIKFLTIDHINNDGAEELKKYGSRRKLYHYLRKMNYPKGYQILCYNCNCSKGFYGKCPHKK